MRAPRLLSATLGLALAAGAVVTTTPDVAAEGLLVTGPMEPGNNWFAAQRQLDGELTRAEAAKAARRQALQLQKTTAAVAPELLETQWQLEGPRNIGGRVTDIAIEVDPTLPNVLYVAAASGGVWKSEDFGATYTPAWPDHFPQAIGALEIGPDGTLWAGTGEANPGGGSITFGGEGIFKSTDSGESWEFVGLPESGAIGRMAVDPTNPDRVLVAASGDLYNPGGERGLYETTDGGATWELKLAGDNDTTGAVDVSLDPQNPDRYFVAMWDHLREPDLRRYGGPGSGLYVTTDGGDTFEKVGGGLPQEDMGRIGVAVAPSAPDIVYTIFITPEGPLHSFHRSIDGGATWTEVDEGPNPALGLLGFSQSSYGWWFGRIFVDPLDPLHIHVAGLVAVRSETGGTVLDYIPNVHADQHAVEWHPTLPNIVYLGNDGGVFRNDAGGRSLEWIPGIDEPWTQHYSVNISQQDHTRLVSGLQDNGVNRNYGGIRNPQELPLGAGVNVPVPDGTIPEDGPIPNPAGGQNWNEYNGGDGLAARIHPGNQDIVFGCSQYGSCSRNTAGGDTGGSAGFQQAPGSRRGWYMPLEFDPTNPDVMYAGNEVVSRSTDQGASWQVISDDLGYGIDDDFETDLIRDPAGYAYGTVTTIEPAYDESTVWAGTDNGLLWVTEDLGDDGWVDLYDEALPRMWITRIAADPNDAATAYVTYSGFRQGDDDAIIVKVTHLGGGEVEVTNISGELPAAPLHDVLVVDGRLVVASDVGVFVSYDDGITWLTLGDNLPKAPVMELAYNEESAILAAATFGRGVYSALLP